MKQRIITACALIAIAVPLLYFGGWCTVVFATVVGITGVIEILKTGKGKKWNPAVYVITILGSLMMIFWYFLINYFNKSTPIGSIPDPFIIRINVVVLAFYLIALLAVEVTTKNFLVNDVFYLFTMTVLICIASQGIIFIREEMGIKAIGFVVFVTYCCDTFALVFGLSFGKHKFAPITSPKKTWEGVIGGVASATILGTAYYAIFPFFDKPYGYWVSAILSLILGIGAVWGDLIFSSIKRQFSIKDFGTIFPGHGGMLDRVDSLLLNILIFITVFGIYSMGMFS